MIVVKHLDQIVFDSRQHPSALRPYCSNIEHPSVDSLQKGHGHRYQNLRKYSEDYMPNICTIFTSDNVKTYDLKIIKKSEKITCL